MAGLGCHGGSARIAQSWLGLSVLLPWPWSLGDSISLWTAPCPRPRYPDPRSPCYFEKIGGKGHQIATVGDEAVGFRNVGANGS